MRMEFDIDLKPRTPSLNVASPQAGQPADIVAQAAKTQQSVRKILECFEDNRRNPPSPPVRLGPLSLFFKPQPKPAPKNKEMRTQEEITAEKAQMDKEWAEKKAIRLTADKRKERYRYAVDILSEPMGVVHKRPPGRPSKEYEERQKELNDKLFEVCSNYADQEAPYDEWYSSYCVIILF